MDDLTVRPAEQAHLATLADMCHCLWPDSTAAEHERELAPRLAGKFPGELPAEIFVAHRPDGRIVGFIEVGLRSHADGCDASHPVGFIEGWYVTQSCRRKRIGARLIAAAEQWAREQGCSEMASDTWIDNIDSQHAHEALGFEETDRCVHYRKQL